MAGSLVVIKDNEEVPVDMIVLATSHPEGKVYYDTANLDGYDELYCKFLVVLVYHVNFFSETYLKQGSALRDTYKYSKGSRYEPYIFFSFFRKNSKHFGYFASRATA